MTTDSIMVPLRTVRAKRSQLKIKPEQMKMLVEHCAPHLALNLYDLAPIKFSRPLPRSMQMIEKGIDASDPEKIMGAMSLEDSFLGIAETTTEKPNLLSSKSGMPPVCKKTSFPRAFVCRKKLNATTKIPLKIAKK